MRISDCSSDVCSSDLDDPESLGSIRALLVVRSGVEFWAGLAVFFVLLRRSVVRQHRRRGHEALAELAPFALWGYALYEATCGLRDGCLIGSAAVRERGCQCV